MDVGHARKLSVPQLPPKSEVGQSGGWHGPPGVDDSILSCKTWYMWLGESEEITYEEEFVDIKNLEKCQVYVAVLYLHLIIIISLQQKCILTF